MPDLPLQDHLRALSARDMLPAAHVRYLERLAREGFRPRVIYDIGASLLHWTRHAERVWPGATVVLFDAFAPAAFLYEGRPHFVGLLTDRDGRRLRFYQNDRIPFGNSYYREVGYKKEVFPADRYVEHVGRALDSVVRELRLPLPDLVKIDVQGAERDVIAGGSRALAHATRLIVEMQRVVYNDGAPLVGETLPFVEARGFRCTDPLFSDNGPDGDYGFVRAFRDCEGEPVGG